MTRKGTNNKAFVPIVKDKLKQLLFVFSFKKYALRKHLIKAASPEEKLTVCNQILGVHQNSYEILTLIELLQEKKIAPEVLIEIGTANGGNNLLLASCFASVQMVIGIDLYVKNAAQLHFYLKGKQVHCIHASSYDVNTIQQVKRLTQGFKTGLIFVDGDHRYMGVKADFWGYKDMFGHNTCMAFHDIVPDNFLRYGEITPMWVGEVPKFWNELKQQADNTIEIIQHPQQNGLGIGVLLP
ncbi:MAG: hypothetical protein EKK39_11670 [Sphingobacteriales bacterium]|uniref:CmcI family methyltransferase n=1 Tax=Hydrotalea flava TaxID=714549 RepID=UPI000FBB579A|nr:CmcI family methyltransferase [Hydrotalea flava]RTL49074.1 MAG: hypothetical protein EKK39_11670 [Sphingobacteriales bacterium]